MTVDEDPRTVVERLYKLHSDRVLRYAQRRVSSHDAEEVVAQTFLVAWRRAGGIPPDPLPWLIGIARNVIRNLDRAGRRQSRLRAQIKRASGPEGNHDYRPELRDEVGAALATLSEVDREVLMLVAWDELDHEEAAAAMGWSRANFRLRLHRARKRLKQRLGDSHISFPRSSVTPAREEAR